MDTLKFNNSPSHIMHIDLNSCFATIEQQANPTLRGKPIAVAAFNSPKGCILAASIEAKRFGIKTGMRVMDGKALFPGLIILSADPWKYRNIHLKFRKLISEYTNDFAPKSIDEFVLNLSDICVLSKLSGSDNQMIRIAIEIKSRIKKEIGDWLTVSVGIAPNRYLAKIGAGLHKPDGLDEINSKNFLDIYSSLKLTDLTGIKDANAARLNSVGIYTVREFYEAPVSLLKTAFHSITGLYWHSRLSGYEVDNVEYGRRSYGNSTAIGKAMWKVEDLSPILARLTEKMSARLRTAGYTASGIHLTIIYKNGSWWHKGYGLAHEYFDARDFYKAAFKLLILAQPESPVLNLAVSCFNLTKSKSLQLNFFDNTLKKRNLVKATDIINKRWGDFTVAMARSASGSKTVMDRIAFGGVKELEEFLTN